eukprot:7135844-Prymnesium_polylepis.1
MYGADAVDRLGMHVRAALDEQRHALSMAGPRRQVQRLPLELVLAAHECLVGVEQRRQLLRVARARGVVRHE